MTDASNMRGYLKLFEAAAPDYVGPKTSDSVSYNAEQTKGEISKITAVLKAKDSERYTKLGRNLIRITTLTEEIKTLQEETKGEARELIADLFHAEDAACTRVVDTVGFMFHMSKDPKAVGSVSYSKVLDELQAHLTPELLSVLETLKAKHTSAPVQKAASLKATDKAAPVAAEESINEGFGDQLKGFFAKMLGSIQSWGKSYDAKLDALKSQMQMGESIDAPRGGTSEAYTAGRKAYYIVYSTKRADRPRDAAKCPYSNPKDAADWKDGWNDMSEYGWTDDDVKGFMTSEEVVDEDQVNEFMGGGSSPAKVLRGLEDAASASGNFVVLDKANGQSLTLIDRNKKTWKVTVEPAEMGEGYDDGVGNVDGGSEACEHDWHEGVDDDGHLVEPPYDVCVNCGAKRH